MSDKLPGIPAADVTRGLTALGRAFSRAYADAVKERMACMQEMLILKSITPLDRWPAVNAEVERRWIIAKARGEHHAEMASKRSGVIHSVYLDVAAGDL